MRVIVRTPKTFSVEGKYVLNVLLRDRWELPLEYVEHGTGPLEIEFPNCNRPLRIPDIDSSLYQNGSGKDWITWLPDDASQTALQVSECFRNLPHLETPEAFEITADIL